MAKNRRLPPMNDKPSGALFGPTVTGYTVASWCPTPDATGPATAVAIVMNTRLPVLDVDCDIVLRLKSPQRVDEMIQSLLRHKRDVWPDSP